MILAALEQNPLFISAALPSRVFPPLFNRYQGGQSFGTHVDNAIRQVTGTPHRIRTDLSATLFFAGPEEYDGGELVVEDTYGTHNVKLPAGHMILYPATSLHHVRPVTRGPASASFFWIQSMVRDDGQRTLLFDLDSAIQGIAPPRPTILQTVAPDWRVSQPAAPMGGALIYAKRTHAQDLLLAASDGGLHCRYRDPAHVGHGRFTDIRKADDRLG